MKNNLFQYLEKYKTPIKKAGNPVTDLIKDFQIELNKESGITYILNGKKLKSRKYSFPEVRKKLEGLNEQQLRLFISECKDYKNRHFSFRKRFFGGFKTQEW